VHTNGKTVHSEAREVIVSIVKLCVEEGRRKQLTFPLNRATDRAARYMGVSTALIKTIRQQSEDRDEKGTVSLLCQGNTGLDLLMGMSPLTPLICQW
jgi:hypothetical protein